MRFRAPNMTQGGAQSLAGGIGDVFRNIAMAPAYEMQAAQQYQDAEASRLLRDTQRQKLEFDMQAARQKQAADAAEAAAQAERTSIGSLIANGARISGVPEAQVPDFSQYLQTGQMPGRYGEQAGSNMLGAVRQAPGDGMGPVQPVPSFYGDNTGQRVMRQAGLAGQALAIGDKSTENLAKASDIYGNQALRDAILSGDRSAGEVGQAQAAIAGKPLVQNIGDTGSGFNQFTGARQQLDPGLVAIFGEKAAAEVAARQAQAGASRASAASSYASAAKTRADVQRDAKSGDISVVQAPDGSVQLVNKVTGLSRPAVGMDGKPVMKGGGAGAKTMTEGQAKALLFGGRMQAANDILNGMEDEGVLRPGWWKGAAETTGRVIGLGTESVGGTLSDLGGSAMNWSQSGKQQQVEQARRDFINAVLRRESGAVISPSEFANAEKQYFPEIGDSPEKIQQKRANRQLATKLLLAEVPDAMRAEYMTAPTAIPPQPGTRNTGGATGTWGDAPAGSTPSGATVSNW